MIQMLMNTKNNHNSHKGPYNVTIIYDTLKKAEKLVEKDIPKNFEEARILLSPWQQAVLFGAVAALLGFGGAFQWFARENNTISESEPKGITEKPKDSFEGIPLEAKAAFVFDITNRKTIYTKNSEAQLPLASLAKLMTALIAEETLLSGEAVVLSKEAISEEGDNGLLVGEEWRKDDLIRFTLLVSSNDGAHALASAVEAIHVKESMKEATTTPLVVSFSEIMNARAQDLGLVQTYFLNAKGLDMHGRAGGAYGSARDVASLLAHILAHAPAIFDATQYTEMAFVSLNGVTHVLKNTNSRAARIPGIVASKTGFTDVAGGNLAIIFEAGPMYPIAVVVLGSSVEGRFTDVETLIRATLASLNLESRTETFGSVRDRSEI